MNRKAVVALGALWMMLWLAHGLARLERMQRDAPMLVMSPGERAAIETGDPVLLQSIRSGVSPGPLATEFERFRTAFERYPLNVQDSQRAGGGARFPFLPLTFLSIYYFLFRRSAWSKSSAVDRVGMLMLPCVAAVAYLEAAMPRSAWSNWDAWAVWDLKTKAVLHEGWLPASFLGNSDYAFSHPEYPLLWPWLEAILSRIFGGFDARVLRLLPVVSAAAVPFVVSALLAELGFLHGRWLVAGMIATLPMVLAHSSNGYVDWPLAAVESAALLLAMRCRRGAAPGWAVGLAVGVAANLKMEGLIFGIGLVSALALEGRRTRAGRRQLMQAAGVFAGLALPWQWYRQSLGITAADFGLPLDRMVVEFPNRTFLFLRGIVLEAFGAGPNGGTVRDWVAHLTSTWLVFWFAAGYALLTGWRRLSRPEFRIPLVVLAVQILGAWAAYLLTIRDPQWLITTSLDRLMLQSIPSVTLLSCALLVGKR